MVRDEMSLEVMQWIAELGCHAHALPEFRQQVMLRLRLLIPYDSGLFHALSPRVSLDTGALVDIDREQLEQSMRRWDTFAVEFERLRQMVDRRQGVASDRDAFPLGSPQRTAFESHIPESFQARSLMVCHLSIRDTVHAAIVLFRRTALPFREEELGCMRTLVPVLSLADWAQQRFDRAPIATVSQSMRCEDQRLSTRQREMVEHVARGHTNAEIALAMGISPNTLRNQLAAIFKRVGAANRADLVRLAVLRSVRDSNSME